MCQMLTSNYSSSSSGFRAAKTGKMFDNITSCGL